MVRKILAVIVIWKVILTFITYLAQTAIPFNATFTPFRNTEVLEKPLPYSIVVFGNFDGIHYIQIAQRGYQLLEQPFFPFYPITIHLVSVLSSSPYLISSQVISITALVLALILIFKLAKIDAVPSLFPLIAAVILLFPTSYSYSTSYNDSLFFLLATLTIYLGRKEKWFTASVCAFFATLTRLNGLALVFYLAVEYFNNKRTTSSKSVNIFEKAYILFLPILAFLGYMLYVQKVFKSWNLIFSTMKIWGQDKVTLPIQVFWRYFKIVFLHPNINITYGVAILELVSVLLYIFIIIFAFKKIRLSYWIFTIASLLIPSFTGSFQGMPRYGLHLYPLFLAIALFLKTRSKTFKLIYFTVSFILLIICVSLFTRGYFVA